jgi:microcystin-dependent protein
MFFDTSISPALVCYDILKLLVLLPMKAKSSAMTRIQFQEFVSISLAKGRFRHTEVTDTTTTTCRQTLAWTGAAHQHESVQPIVDVAYNCACQLVK